MGKIYTKRGDKGKTQTFFGEMSKAESLAEALGGIDELNSWIGLCRTKIQKTNDKYTNQIQKELKKIQNNLLVIGSGLSGSGLGLKSYEVRRLERVIDKLTEELPPLKNFIYPVGELQVARAVCRRAERRVVGYLRNNAPSDPPLYQRGGRGSSVLRYLNRLSDALFVMARWVNFKLGGKEEVWRS
ncbi:MAG: hypothetical protein UY33_C0028G0011 [Candidatus Amesbacteria bacterium GW2011_GWA1_48_9]|uniref:Corrinoid adenosyltransferase n=1 Tax=Candidatus Amesbacteria bacterium GW2011_GWA1_48_9 TaxID=1618355 RepID=A0A0G1UZH1_9BACT|nr:MAG: hypothetical protein UY33_C0028G0011 [Candidatus Amesbacteria bacterium GW2011_GWA1_48_9]OGC97209.1 MAG: ATP:cob(I)alamin adenosyltransferase [Candidatus Amesbacteria bacterium RBG_16_48_31]